MSQVGSASWLSGRIVGYNMFKVFGWPKLLPAFVTISVTDRCNSRCKTCGIWKRKPQKRIMGADEYGKFFGNYGRIFWLTIEGGEPFLREDLAEIVFAACSESSPAWITIATNGSMPERTVLAARDILSRCHEAKLIINVSIDGVGKQHDNIRGMDGSFRQAVRTVRALKRIRNPRLVVGVNTVVSKYNAGSFGKILDYVTGSLKPDSFVAEVAENRAKLYADGQSITPSAEELCSPFSEMARICRKSKTYGPARNARIDYYHRLAENRHDDHHKNFEGIASVYIMPDGEAWLSCSKKLVAGNIRKVGYDLGRIWYGRRANRARRMMSSGYSTTAANAYYTNYVCNLANSAGLAVHLALGAWKK